MTTTAGPSMSKSAAPQGGPGAPQGNTGSSRLNALIQALETVQIENQYDLHEFCEALRGLGHRLAVETMMGSHELEAGLKEQAKADATLGIPGFDARRAIRGTIRQFKTCADHFASAAGCAAAGWTSFEKNFDQALSRKAKPARRGGFKIEG